MAWTKTFHIPTSTSSIPVNISGGDVILIAGPNGVGKSALLHMIALELGQTQIELFPGHRQIHFQSANLDQLGVALKDLGTHLFSNPEHSSRIRSSWSEDHLKSVLKRLVLKETQINADIVAEGRRTGTVRQASDWTPSLIDTTNNIFQIAKLPIRVKIENGVLAAERDGDTYGIDELSDGERAALLLVGAILVREDNTVIAIDEPEKHLHPSISGPLIAAAVRSRRDLSYLLSSHDLPLIDWLSPSSIIHVRESKLLSRAHRQNPESRTFDVHILSKNDGVQEELKRAILGSRRLLLFVEGEDSSEDRALYSHIYKGWNVVACGGWDAVTSSVRALRQNVGYHWLKVYGLIDGDGRSEEEQNGLRIDGIYSLSTPTIENLFCLEEVVREAADVIHHFEGGAAGPERLRQIENELPALFMRHKDDIINRRVVWITNRIVSERKIAVRDISSGKRIIEAIDIQPILDQQSQLISDMIDEGSAFDMLRQLPIKNTAIPAKVSTILGFSSFSDYKRVVLRQLDLETPSGKNIIAALRRTLPSLPS